jgi:exopolysaccharide biosynthesis polyprenyl glycosylphosphotransferase
MFEGGSAATAATVERVVVPVTPTIDVAAPARSRSVALLVKSSFDVVCAALSLIILAPFLLVVAAAVRFTSQGPALFRQTRVGRNGETFTILKFRTMYSGAERRLAELLDHNDSEGGVLFKMHNDPRITPIGRVLRRLSVDELPQLINVLTGAMSLVGPRPPLPSEVSRYGARTRRRLLVKPGITGLWQVSGRSNLSWEDSISLDLNYVENWSLALDTKVLFATARAVLTADGAY